MIDKIDLRYFLKPDSKYPSFREPFLFKNHTVAMNGGSIIFLKRDPKYKKIDIKDGMKKFLNKILTELKEREKEALTLDIKIPEPSSCVYCGETGKLLIKTCPECDGEGDLDFRTSCNFYSVVCRSCDGIGKIETAGKGEPCVYCNGTRRRFKDQHIVWIDDQKFDAALLFPFKDVGLKVLRSKNIEALLFWGEDFKGLIMGMRDFRVESF